MRTHINLSFLKYTMKPEVCLPSSWTVFLTEGLVTFSNFTFCLKKWQVKSLRYMVIRIPPEGMGKYLAELNDVVSFVSLGLQGLLVIPMDIYLYYPLQNLKDRFWAWNHSICLFYGGNPAVRANYSSGWNRTIKSRLAYGLPNQLFPLSCASR